jgi:hypothetical protein
MAYIKPELVAKAKEMDLLTYLQNYEPSMLVRLSGGEYCTKEHDSLKISNGKWCWWSRGIGGRSALDYLIKVQGIPFLEAVQMILGEAAVRPPVFVPAKRDKRPDRIAVPKMVTPRKAYDYLTEERCIDRAVVSDCIKRKMVMETEKQEAAFVGYDSKGEIRCINLRAINDSDGKKTVYGSDRQYAFRLVSNKENRTLHLFEGAVDLLSYLTFLQWKGIDYRAGNFLSLGGIYQPKKEIKQSAVPVALKRYLSERKTNRIMLHFDNDFPGRRAAEALITILPEYEVKSFPPPRGKDYNDYLVLQSRGREQKEREVCR